MGKFTLAQAACLLMATAAFPFATAQALCDRPDGQTVSAQLLYEKADSLAVERIVRQAPPEATPDYFARLFLGTPYVGHTLERSLDTEPLVVNMRELDCTTLVEAVAALWHTANSQTCPADTAPPRNSGEKAVPDRTASPFARYCYWLERYRYWGGKRDGYLSRHHYFSWWWHDNVEQNLLEEVDLAASGAVLTPLAVKINYMSLHPNLYRQLAAHPEWVEQLKPLEQQYSGHDGQFLSQEELRRIGSAALKGVILDGDVVAIVTTKGGLDYSHLGFASWQADGRLHLLNASSIHKKVVDEPKTLWQYLNEHKSSIGIRVFRLR